MYPKLEFNDVSRLLEGVKAKISNPGMMGTVAHSKK